MVGPLRLFHFQEMPDAETLKASKRRLATLGRPIVEDDKQELLGRASTGFHHIVRRDVGFYHCTCPEFSGFGELHEMRQKVKIT